MPTKIQLEAMLNEAYKEMSALRNQFSEMQSKVKESSVHIQKLQEAHDQIEHYKKLSADLAKIDAKFNYDTSKNQINNIAALDKEISKFHQQALAADKGYKSQFDKLKRELEAYVAHSKVDSSSITHGNTGYKVQSERALKSCKNMLDEVMAYQKRLLKGSSSEDAISAVIKSAQKEIESKLNDVRSFHEELLSHSDGGEHESLKSKVVHYENVIQDLKAKMYGLLPQVAGASLSHAYFDAKSNHGPTRPRKSDKTYKKWWIEYPETALKYLGAYLKPAFFYLIFIGPIIVTIMLFAPVFLGSSIQDILGGQTITPPSPKDIVWSGVFFRFLIAVPMGIISLFGHRSIVRSRRLYEEYDHKQRVMELYTGFRQEAEQLGEMDRNHRSRLMGIVLHAVGDKPLSIRHDKELNNDSSGELGNDTKSTPAPAKKKNSSKTATQGA